MNRRHEATGRRTSHRAAASKAEDRSATEVVLGAYGALVERTADFAAAFDEALACGRPALIELRVDQEALTPRQSLSEVREAAQARLSAP